MLKEVGRLCFFAFVAATAVACSRHDSIANAIFDDFDESDRRTVDLDRALPRPWKRVCMFGPYTDNATTDETLGFKWNSQKFSEVWKDEGATLLVFVAADEKVAFFTDYRRSRGDFSNLSRQCFERLDARFEHVPKPAKGRPGLYPIK
ncbi:hypothetical protein NHH88_20695 [Oxalobacteraceae bacterium OTU3CAMAD1]|nr:hypothetical protein NHH88_20695 [Oxalobacteraceae bacterium OTU3CAMAD1]